MSLTSAGASVSGGAPTETLLPEWRRTAAFFAVAVAFVLEVADSTVVNTALPQIRASIGGGPSAMQWIAASYFLSLGALLLIGGRLGDIFGYKRVFVIGIAAFIIASCLCGLARNAEELVAARFIQGAAGALMAPQVMAIVQVLFSPLERIARLAWFGVLGGLAAVLGPVAGGLLIEWDLLSLGWRLIFLINLPIGLVALVAALRFIPRLEGQAHIRIDCGGAVLFVLAFALLLLALIEGPEQAWPVWTLASAAAGGSLLAWAWHRARQREARGLSAVIAPDLFNLATFRWGMAAIVAFSAASSGFLLVLAVSLQQGLGRSALDTALLHMPFGLGVMAGISVIGRRYLPRLGKWLIVAGAGVMSLCAGLVLLDLAFTANTGTVLLALLLLAGLGMGMIIGPLPPVIVAQVERAKAGSASAMMRTAQQIGGALGIALIGAAYFSVGGNDATARLDGLLPALAAFLLTMLVCVATALRLPAGIFQKG